MNRGARTKIKTHFNHLEKDAAEQFLLRPKPDGSKFRPSADKVGRLLVKVPNAIYWSVERFAETLNCDRRTIVRAFAELKDAGFLKLVRRRRGTTIKVICMDAIRDGAANAITRAIKACVERLKNQRATLVKTPMSDRSHSIVRDFGYRTQNGASEGLKRAAAALSRTPKLFGA
jgi:biotin operon repressor